MSRADPSISASFASATSSSRNDLLRDLPKLAGL
jgi:hypothetical protein